LVVRVYSSGDQVRLLLNGREIGVKAISADTKRKAEFEVPYAAGELKAIALENGKQIAELAFQTAGPPVELRLVADRQTIRADRRDLSFVTLEVVDRSGNLVPDAVIPVVFRVSGAGELAGAGSANPKDVASFRQPGTRTFQGRCLAVVRPTGQAGAITLTADAEGIPQTSLQVTVRAGG
jgi:beta-galactosidase